MREKFTAQLVHGCTDEMKAEVEEMAVPWLDRRWLSAEVTS
jgi:hypothetical protein